jgi:hypothetical protein
MLRNAVLMRAVAFAVTLVSALLLPWWASAFLMLAALFAFGAYEMLVIALLMDALYGTGYWYVSSAALASLAAFVLRRRLFLLTAP